MGKRFPRFLVSNPSNTKTKGPFIVHTLDPKFICKPKFDEKRQIVDFAYIEMFNEADNVYKYSNAHSVLDDMKDWYKFSGIHQSENEEDKILSELYKIDYLKEEQVKHFSVIQVQELIKIIYPTKARNIYQGTSSYGLKHLMENISQTILGPGKTCKYCSNNTLKEAFELEGFKYVEEGPNRYFNILASENNRAYKLFWNT